jgi:hypothetical protein
MTSIHPPSRGVAQFADCAGWQSVVVGDRRTPEGWRHPGVLYLSPAAQAELGTRLFERLPWNHYARKMLGYLHAARAGASLIFETDDDNMPRADWAVPSFEGQWPSTPEGLGFVNVYRSFTAEHVWPRGFPLRRINDARGLLTEEGLAEADVRVGIWQGLVDGNPDVDAIHRLVFGRPCTFRVRAPIVLGAGTVCPFNSQATAFRRELFPLMYLPTTVSSRATDIVRGLVAQPILWAAGYRLGFTGASLVQERNPHDLLDDFVQEIPIYRHTETIVELAGAAVERGRAPEDNLLAVYQALARAGVVADGELGVVAAWLEDLAR